MKIETEIVPDIVLASSSPYRRELLEKIIPAFSTATPDIDESSRQDEAPLHLSKRLAFEKASALTKQYPHHLIIGSDQVAMLDNIQLHKPGSFEKCVQQLQLSSGKIIKFYTSLCVLNSKTGEHHADIDVCSVHMKSISDAEITAYVNREKPFNCAAAFKSEGLGIALFKEIEGSDPNALVGLPLIKLIQLLEKFNYHVL